MRAMNKQGGSNLLVQAASEQARDLSCVSFMIHFLFIGVPSGQKQTLLSKPFSFFKLLSSECCYDVVVR